MVIDEMENGLIRLLMINLWVMMSGTWDSQMEHDCETSQQ